MRQFVVLAISHGMDCMIPGIQHANTRRNTSHIIDAYRHDPHA